MPLADLLAAHPPGTWLVLDPKLTKILGSGLTPEVAMREAGLPTRPVSEADDPGYGKRPVLMQIPPPGLYF